MTVILQGPRARMATVPLLFRASACLDESGLYAIGYGRRIAGGFTRASRKRILDQHARRVAHPHGSPPLGVAAGEPALLLELPTHQYLIHSHAISSWNLQAGATVTPNVLRSVEGKLTADLVTGGGVIESGVWLAPAYTVDGDKGFYAELRAGTSPRTDLLIYDATVPTTRVRVQVDWAGGVPTATVTSGGGTGEVFRLEPLADGFWGIPFRGNGVVAANSTRVYLYPDNASPYNRNVYVGFMQAEDRRFPSSPIATLGASTGRAQDVCYFDVPGLNPPRPISVYVRGVSRSLHPGASASQKIFHLGNVDPGIDPRLGIQVTSGGAPQGYYDDGVTPQFMGANPVVVSRGDVFEALVTLDEFWTVRSVARVNGGALGASGPGVSGRATAWSLARAHFGSVGDAGDYHLTHGVIADGVRGFDAMVELAGV